MHTALPAVPKMLRSLGTAPPTLRALATPAQADNDSTGPRKRRCRISNIGRRRAAGVAVYQVAGEHVLRLRVQQPRLARQVPVHPPSALGTNFWPCVKLDRRMGKHSCACADTFPAAREGFGVLALRRAHVLSRRMADAIKPSALSGLPERMTFRIGWTRPLSRRGGRVQAIGRFLGCPTGYLRV